MVRSRCWERLSPRRTLLQFLYGANPYFANVDPNQGNVSWLSQDLRVFTATPSVNNTPVPGGPVFGADSFDGAYTYIQALLGYLNANFSNPSSVDPFSAASNVIPRQTGAYTGDSSVTPSANSHNNYNFASTGGRKRVCSATSPAGPCGTTHAHTRETSTQTADTVKTIPGATPAAWAALI